MDPLPVEIFVKILNYLDLNDLIRCRLVNSNWNLIIKNYIRIDSLIVRPKVKRLYEKFFDFNFKSNESNQFITENVYFLSNQLMKSILKNLKQLFINTPHCIINQDDQSIFSFINFINQFILLEQLEIKGTELILKRSDTLSLNLKILTIGCSISGNSKLKLNTPNLDKFSCRLLDNLEFIYPQSVKHLKFDTDFDPETNPFLNLESCGVYGLFDFEDDILSLMPNLKLLSICEVNRVDVVRKILISKKKLKRLDFKFYYQNIEISSVNDLDQFVNPDDRTLLLDVNDNFVLVLANYSKLANYVPSIYKIHYSSLIRHFRGQIDSNFFDKFIAISDLIVDEPVKIDEFLKFIKKYRNLVSLELNNSRVGQSIFNQLPNYHPDLWKLHIHEETDLDLEFILSFNRLDDIKVNQTVTIAFILKVLTKFKHLCDFTFRFNNKTVKICSYSVIHSIEISDKKIEFKNNSELLEFLERLDLFL